MVFQVSCHEGAVGACQWEGFLEEVAWAGHSGRPGSRVGNPKRVGLGAGKWRGQGGELGALWWGPPHWVPLSGGSVSRNREVGQQHWTPQSSSLGPSLPRTHWVGHASSPPLPGAAHGPMPPPHYPSYPPHCTGLPLIQPTSLFLTSPHFRATFSHTCLWRPTHLLEVFTLQLCLLTNLFLKSVAAFEPAETPSAHLPILSESTCP